MLAANVENAKQAIINHYSREQAAPPAKAEKQIEIELVDNAALAAREEEEEGESDADADFDDEIESEFEDAADFEIQGYVASDRKGTNARYRSETPELPTYRKRSHDEASEEREIGPATPPAREGTPPKRPRLVDHPTDLAAAAVLDVPPLRQRKRSSEELEEVQATGLQSPKRVKA